MSTDRDTTRIVRSWLRTDGHESADRVLDAVLDRLDTTPQRRATWWPARRLPEMNNTAKLGLAAAALVAVAFLGLRFLVPGEGIGGPGPTPTPTPDATPISLSAVSGELAAGTYVFDSPEMARRYTFTVPAGWWNHGGPVAKGGFEPPAGAGFSVWDLSDVRVYRDPCRVSLGFMDPAVGPTVDDFATALASFEERVVTPPTDVTLGGYAGKLMELMVPEDISFGDCDSNEYRTWRIGQIGDRYHQGPGQHDRLWIIDVRGQRLAIDAAFFAATPAETLAELEAIVESIRFD
jgi:hypothetical protein